MIWKRREINTHMSEYQVWLGAIYDDVVSGKKIDFEKYFAENGELPTHVGLGLAIKPHSKRWRYRDGVDFVFWWEEPTKDEKWLVEQFLQKRGIMVMVHKSMLEGNWESDFVNGILNKTITKYA